MKNRFDQIAIRIRPLFDRLFNNSKSFEYVSEIENLALSNRSQIERHQLNRIRSICQAASKTIYYAELFKRHLINDPQSISWEDFHNIPPLSKEVIRNRLDDLMLHPENKSGLRKSGTSGSTAAPVEFYMDWDSLDRRNAGTIYFNRWFGYRPGMKIAYLWGALQDIPKRDTLKARIKEKLFERELYLPARTLDDNILYNYYMQLKKFRPSLLQGYPSALNIFSEFLLKNYLKLHIPAISCTAEPLLSNQIKNIESAFGVTPYNWYGARDGGRVATECHYHSGMHINEYGIYLEIIKNSLDQGGILITDLWNLEMPLIRYEIGDMGNFDYDDCRCGVAFRRLKEITGRTSDIFIGKDNIKVPGVTFVNRILTDCREIQGIQVIQKNLCSFELRIVKGPAFCDESVSSVKNLINEAMRCLNNFDIIYVDKIETGPSGKKRICINEMI